MKTPRPQLPALALAAGLPGAAAAARSTPAAPAASSRRLLKVCGLRDAASLAAVAALKPDFLGFIFAPASPRFAGELLTPALLQALPPHSWKVGVFVSEEPARIIEIARQFGLGAVQLHGHETPAQCQELSEAGLLVIKAFAVGEGFDLTTLRPYVPFCDFFLFDAKGAAPGGNGTVFDWRLLAKYDLPVPYLLAGGLAPQHAAELAALHLPGLVGFDLNSGFETAPGVKNAGQLRIFMDELRAAAPATPAL